MSTLEVGDIVEDRDDPDPDEAAIINLPPAQADDWVAYSDNDGDDVTVAEDNPDYPGGDDVAIVLFTDDLKRTHPDWLGKAPIRLSDARCKFYSFPTSRLVVGDRKYEPPEPQLDECLKAVESRLAERARVEREERDGEVVLVVEKLGEEYVIRRDGLVEGDGALAERIGAVVREITL